MAVDANMEYAVEYHDGNGWNIHRFYFDMEMANREYIRRLKTETDITVVWRFIALPKEEMTKYVFENNPRNL